MRKGVTQKQVSTVSMPYGTREKRTQCAYCGYMFERLSGEWAYYIPNGRGGKRWCCSYKCMRAAEAATVTRRIKAMDTADAQTREDRDITGRRYGMLTVIGRADQPKACKRAETYWACRCDCGRELVIGKQALRRGKQDCGCQPRQYNTEAARAERQRQAAQRRAEIMRRTGCTKSEYASMSALTLREEVCPVCKKRFDLLSTQWAYKQVRKHRGRSQTVYYCSWRCFRKAE